MANVSLRKLGKSFGTTKVLHDIDLEIEDGEFVVLVGPSGCGKSTTLRIIAGLEEATSGEVEIAGRVVNNLEPKDRNIAMVFQNYAIYPHMTVRKNIGFGLRTSKMSRVEKTKRLEEVADLLGMTDYLDRKPAALSGGQRQRVAIGRAMVRDPAVFLFDEPLSNLDAQLRTQMRLEIKKLHQRVGNTVIFVTHDQVEAMTMADRIVIMKDGVIQQIGTPPDVYHHPANTFVASFIGAPSMNMVSAHVTETALTLNGNGALARPENATAGQSVILGVRPDDLTVGEGDPIFVGQVTVLEPLGSETLVYVAHGETEVIAKASGRRPPKIGETVTLVADPETLHYFDSVTGASLA